MKRLLILLALISLTACSTQDTSDSSKPPAKESVSESAKVIAPITLVEYQDVVDLVIGQVLVFKTLPDELISSATLSIVEGSDSIVSLSNGNDFETYSTNPALTALYPGTVKVRLVSGTTEQVFTVNIFAAPKSDPTSPTSNPGFIGENVDPGIVVDKFPGQNDGVEMPSIDPLDDAAKNTSKVASKIIGMEKDRAEEYLKTNNISMRVGEEDGEVFALTMDYSPNRVTVAIFNNKITDFSVG